VQLTERASVSPLTMITIDGIVFSLQRHGGVSVYFHRLLRYLSENSEPATCLVEEPSLQNPVGVGGSVRVARRPSRTLERYRRCRVSKDTSLFHSSYYRLPTQRDLATVVTVYDFVYERWQHGPRLWVHREQKTRAIRSARAVICISQSTKDDLMQFVGETPGQQVHVIHCGVSDQFQYLNLAPPATPYVLFVGQRGGYKNFGQILQAMSYLPDLELRCVGGGPFERSELSRVPDAVRRRVRHLGLVTDEELNVLYGRAQCLAYPSLYEGFGIPVIEAMRAGCPVVSRDCQAVLEVGKDALTVVTDGDPRAMAKAIVRTATSDRPYLVQKGLAVAMGYSWDATHRQTLEVYRALGV